MSGLYRLSNVGHPSPITGYTLRQVLVGSSFVAKIITDLHQTHDRLDNLLAPYWLRDLGLDWLRDTSDEEPQKKIWAHLLSTRDLLNGIRPTA